MAYTTALILANDLQPNGTRVLRARFTGDAGEPDKEATTTIDTDTTVLSLRRWALSQVAQGGNVHSVGSLPALQAGQSITLTPISPVVPTAAQVWLEKAARLQRADALGLTNAAAVADFEALQSDVDATYVTGYLANV